MDTRADGREESKGVDEESGGVVKGRPTAQGVPRDTGRPGALMRKITRNKRKDRQRDYTKRILQRTPALALIKPSISTGERQPSASRIQLYVRARARARGTTGNLPEILTHPALLPLVLSFCQIQ